MPSVLGYWKIRGLGQPIRLMLGYAGEDFEDVHYEQSDGPEFSREAWMKEKFNLGLDFPNLPYYKNGDVVLTQSNAIMRHLARKYDLMGKTDAEKDRCDQVAEQLVDFRTGWTMLCYGKYVGGDFTKNAPKYAENVVTKLEPFEKFLGDNPWLAGQNISWPDFILFEMLDQHLVFKPSCLDDLPMLKAFHQRMLDEPKVKAFMESPKFFKGPMNNKVAEWGGKIPIPNFA